MGGSVDISNPETIVIEGKDQLHGAKHQIMPDRIEAALI